MKLCILFILYIAVSKGAKILGIYNHPGRSHTVLGEVLLKELAHRGHHVVMISSFPSTKPVSNYRDIFLSEPLEDMKYRTASQNMGIQELKNMTLQHTEYTFTNPQVKELLISNETFDVVIIDWFYNDATLIFGHIYKAPVIYISSFGNMAFLTDFTGNVLPYSYVPGAAQFMSDDMSFKQRLIMTLCNVGINSLLTPRRKEAHYELLKRQFDNPPTIQELQENVALVLSNSHFSFETPRPYTPNIIPVGGFHVTEPKELPQELRVFLDSTTHGVILFSLGSQITSSNLNENILIRIVEVFGKLKQKVLWKAQTTGLPSLPDNIKIVKWLPQSDVLAHPNVKLFITHGGMLSLIESVHHGVPLICMPFNGDQLTNAAFIQSREMGIYLPPYNITKDVFLNAIEEVLTNPKYQQQMDYRSSLLREQPVKPLDLAVYWTEHVIKHRQGNHLKTFATKLPWYKYYLIDVIGFLLLCIFIFLKTALYLLKLIVRKIFKIGKIKSE